MTVESREPVLTPRTLAGLLVAAFGVAMLLDNLDVISVRGLWRYWPLGLIVIGVAKVIQERDHGNRIGGWILIGLGLLFSVETLVFFRFDVWRWWPLALIVLGLMIVMRAFAPATPASSPSVGPSPPPAFGTSGMGGYSPAVTAPPKTDVAATSDARVSDIAIWSGVERRITSPVFKHADLTAVMGGIDFDLRQASADNGVATIEVFVLWGGIEIKVPPDWAVQNDVTPIMGGAEDKSTGTQQARHKLIVKGVVIMGGVEIKT